MSAISVFMGIALRETSVLQGVITCRETERVAAPGSGKTVLGLEVIKRVNQPTLVLAPTITIRDQWVDRLVDLFLPPGSGRPAWVSTELRSPAVLTVATYQALHALCSGEPEEQAQAIEAEENGDSNKHLFEPLNNGTDASHGAQSTSRFPRRSPKQSSEPLSSTRHTISAPSGGKR